MYIYYIGFYSDRILPNSQGEGGVYATEEQAQATLVYLRDHYRDGKDLRIFKTWLETGK
jgi:hypothetical protein